MLRELQAVAREPQKLNEHGIEVDQADLDSRLTSAKNSPAGSAPLSESASSSATDRASERLCASYAASTLSRPRCRPMIARISSTLSMALRRRSIPPAGLLGGINSPATLAPRSTRFERVIFALGELRLIQNPALPKQLGSAIQPPRLAPVAQLDRALPSEGKGHTFESCRARHFRTEL